MKINHKIGWLLLTASTITALTLSQCSSNTKPVNHKDSIECKVYEGYPVHHEAEFETYPVFVPVNEDWHKEGDTVLIDQNTDFIVDMPLRDAETMRPVTDGLDTVILHGKMAENMYRKIN